MSEKEKIERLKEYIGKNIVVTLNSKFQKHTFNPSNDKTVKVEDGFEIEEVKGILKIVNFSYLVLKTVRGMENVMLYGSGSGSWSGDEPGSGGYYQAIWNEPKFIKTVNNEMQILIQPEHPRLSAVFKKQHSKLTIQQRELAEETD